MTNRTQKIPNSWNYMPLGEIVTKKSRGIVPNKTPEQIFELYSVPSLENCKPDIISGKEIGSNKQIVDEGTVLLCKINPRINRSWVVGSFSKHQKIASTEWITFPPNGEIDSKFLAYYLKQNEVRDYLAANASGVGGSLMRVKPSTIQDVLFPVAPYDEQKLIVSEIEKQFSRLDEAVAALKRIKANLKRYKASVLKAAVEGRLTEEWRRGGSRTAPIESGRDLLKRILAERRKKWEKEHPGKKYKEPAETDTSNLPELPRGWVWATLSQIALFQNGRFFPSKEYSPEGVKLLRPGNLYADGSVKWTDENTRRLPETWSSEYPDYLIGGSELIMNLTAQSLKDEFLGRTCSTDADEHCLLNQRLARISPLSGVDSRFLLWVLKAKRFRDFVDTLNTGSLIQHMFTSDLAQFNFPMPSLDEQYKIVEEIESRFSVTDEIDTEIETNLKRAERLRQSILKKAFSGRLV